MLKNYITSVVIALGLTTVANAQQVLPVYLDESKPMEQRVEDALSRMTLAEKIAVIHAQSKFSSPGVKRLGFPDLWTDDGPHGVRPDVLWDEWEQAGQTNDSCVAFPALTCLAASWNPQMSRHYGEALGEEALYRGKDMMLGPGVNINRTPLNGRNFEYMGEDPYLTSRMVIPYIQGLQSKGVAACVKHYALNNDEEYRHQVNVIVDDRALHEIYLPAFKAAVTEAGTWAIMGAYNLYKNQHNCHNDIMLNKILKKDWQFDGVVVSDWGGTHDTDEAVKNGLDMEFGTWTDGLTMGATNAYDNYYLATPYYKGILEGKYTQNELDDKVRRVLRLFFRTTMNRNRPFGFLCSESHYHTAKAVAEEGIVLLQNNRNVLPINMQTVKKVLVVGENAIKMMTVGGGSSSLKVQHEISPLDGLKNRLKGVEVEYARGYVGDVTGDYNGVTTGQDLKDNRSAEQLIAEAVEKAKSADYVIMFGGLNKSDYQDCEGHDRKQYELPYDQNKLIEALAKANKKFVYVNISGNAVAMPWKDRVPAIVQGWFLGSEAGNALASILTGDANPSGKLPYTWAVGLNDIPAHKLDAYPGTWRTDKKVIDEEYKEGIFVGYRWFDKEKTQPLFAFGHGLSYTTFEYAVEEAAIDGDRCRMKVSVKNTGKVAGREAVQLYVKAPEGGMDKPAKELKAFGKTRLLKPGESQTLTLEWNVMDMASFNEKSSSWELAKGEYQWMAAASSADVRCTTVQKVAKARKQKVHDAMRAQVPVAVHPMVKR